jgi:hypothetical protein
MCHLLVLTACEDQRNRSHRRVPAELHRDRAALRRAPVEVDHERFRRPVPERLQVPGPLRRRADHVVRRQPREALVEVRRIEMDENDACYDVRSGLRDDELDEPPVSWVPVSGLEGGGGVGKAVISLTV